MYITHVHNQKLSFTKRYEFCFVNDTLPYFYIGTIKKSIIDVSPTER